MVDVMYPGIVFVHANEQFIGKMFIQVDNLGLHALKWCQVACLLRFQVGSKETPVLVAANILNVENMLVVLSPEIETDTTVRIFGHRRVVLAADRADPDV